jgi:2-hydroxy-6-oxonona-2,4-dienedioate hydrolase
VTSNANAPYRSIWSHLSTVAFRQDWIVAGGVKTRFVQAGPRDAPAVIMLHGTGGTWEGFCANLGPLSAHFNCLALDLVGSGYSDKPDRDHDIQAYVDHIRDFMKAMGVARASFIGISMGSWIAARFALKHPGLVDKLVLLAAFGLADDSDEIGAIVARRGKAYDDPNWDTVKAIFDKLIFHERNRIDDLIALRLATYLQPGMKAASSRVLSIFEPQRLRANLIPAEDWRLIQAPALVVASLNDRPLFLNTARAIVALMPAARLLELQEVAHWPQFEDPDRFNRETIEFLLETSAGVSRTATSDAVAR